MPIAWHPNMDVQIPVLANNVQHHFGTNRPWAQSSLTGPAFVDKFPRRCLVPMIRRGWRHLGRITHRAECLRALTRRSLERFVEPARISVTIELDVDSRSAPPSI